MSTCYGMDPLPKSVSIRNLERTIRPLELRAEGRRLEGIILKYGEISPNHQERFVPGAFSLDPGRLPVGSIIGMIELGFWLIPMGEVLFSGILPRLCFWRPNFQPYP